MTMAKMFQDFRETCNVRLLHSSPMTNEQTELPNCAILQGRDPNYPLARLIMAHGLKARRDQWSDPKKHKRLNCPLSKSRRGKRKTKM